MHFGQLTSCQLGVLGQTFLMPVSGSRADRPHAVTLTGMVFEWWMAPYGTSASSVRSDPIMAQPYWVRPGRKQSADLKIMVNPRSRPERAVIARYAAMPDNGALSANSCWPNVGTSTPKALASEMSTLVGFVDGNCRNRPVLK